MVQLQFPLPEAGPLQRSQSCSGPCERFWVVPLCESSASMIDNLVSSCRPRVE